LVQKESISEKDFGHRCLREGKNPLQGTKGIIRSPLDFIETLGKLFKLWVIKRA